MVAAEKYDLPRLLHEWQWLVPRDHTPLLVSVMGDWVFGAPNGSLWSLSLLEGDYIQIAVNADEYNRLNKSDEWLNETFSADWQSIAAGHGFEPTEDQCLGWKVHPLLGGEFTPANLQVFDMVVYQSLMGQLHRQLQRRETPPKKSWFKFWQ
jgi:hypothetical protein